MWCRENYLDAIPLYLVLVTTFKSKTEMLLIFCYEGTTLSWFNHILMFCCI